MWDLKHTFKDTPTVSFPRCRTDPGDNVDFSVCFICSEEINCFLPFLIAHITFIWVMLFSIEIILFTYSNEQLNEKKSVHKEWSCNMLSYFVKKKLKERTNTSVIA